MENMVSSTKSIISISRIPTLEGKKPIFARMKIARVIIVTTGMSPVGFPFLKKPTKIIGPIMAVPAKLVLANSTRCSELTTEKTKASTPKMTMKILVIFKAFLSSSDSNDRNSDPRANICESEVEIAAAMSPINPSAAIPGA